MTKHISIIVPCYNVAAYVEQCVYSIMSNSYRKLEIILINDGSTDTTGEILEHLKQTEDRIKVIHQENKGLSAARNLGIQTAIGEYITFVDSDDWVAPNYLECMSTAIEGNYDLVATTYNRVFHNTTMPRDLMIKGKVKSSRLKRRIIGLLGKELKDPSQADSLVTVWGKLYKSSLIKNNNLSFVDVNEVGTAEDLLFNLSYLKEATGESFIINQPLYYYRKYNASSFTSQYKKDLFFKWQKLFNYIKTNITTVEDQTAFQNRICLSMIGLGLNELSNPNGFQEQLKNLKAIRNSEVYELAYQKLVLRYFPLHWKLFFAAAKYNQIKLLYLLLIGISKIQNSKNS